MIKSYFTIARPDPDPRAGEGDYCPCQSKIKLELYGDGLDFLTNKGYRENDTFPGSCSHCGRPYQYYKLTVSEVADMRGE